MESYKPSTSSELLRTSDVKDQMSTIEFFKNLAQNLHIVIIVDVFAPINTNINLHPKISCEPYKHIDSHHKDRLMLENRNAKPFGVPPLSLFWWEFVLGVFTYLVVIQQGFFVFIDQTHTRINALLYWFDVVTLALFVVDFFLSFRKGFYEKGQLVLDQNRIRSRYSVFWLVTDLFAIAALGVTLSKYRRRLGYFRLVLFFKLYSLYKLDDLLFRKIHTNKLLYSFYVILKMILIFYMFCHYMACLYYWIDLQIYDTQTPITLWTNYQLNYSPVISLDWYTQYLYAMYYSVQTVTTIAYGDCTPKNPYEVAFVTFFLVLSAVTLGYIIEQINQVVFYQNNWYRMKYLTKVFSFNRYLQIKEIEPDIRYKIFSYYEFLWQNERLLKDNELNGIIGKLPYQLQNQLLNQIFLKYMHEVKVLREFDNTFFQHVHHDINQVIYMLGDPLFQQGDPTSDSIHFVKHEYIDLFVVHWGKQLKLESHSRNVYGEEEFFTGMPRRYKATVNKETTVYSISRSAIVKLLRQKEYVKIRQQFFEYSQQLMYYYPRVNVLNSCTGCRENFHTILQCPLMHFVLDPLLALFRTRAIANPRRPRQRRNAKNKKIIYPSVRESEQVNKRSSEPNQKHDFVRCKLEETIKHLEWTLENYFTPTDTPFFGQRPEQDNQLQAAHECFKFYPDCNLRTFSAKLQFNL